MRFYNRTAPVLLRDRSAREDHVRLHPRRAPARCSCTGTCRRRPAAFLEVVAPYRDGSGRRRRVHVHVVLARRCLRGRGHRVRARPRAGHEGDPRRQGEERQDRFPQDRRPAARRDAAAGLRLSRRRCASTRDLLRRRLHLVRKRGQLLAHIQNTRAQYNLPAFEQAPRLPGQPRRASSSTSRIRACARASRSTSR